MTPSHDTDDGQIVYALALCVADASILFDLRNGGALRTLAALPYRFIVPDVVFAELDAPLRGMVQDLGFEIGELGAQAVGEIFALRPEHPRLSVADLFALFVALDRQAMLLTGDARLRKLAEIRGLVVHGTLWALDELYTQHALNALGALAAMEKILALGGRLPPSECQKRRLLWKGPPEME